MTTLHSPTAGRRRLRHALRQARDTAGYTQEQVAEAMDWSLSKVIRIETGTVSISTSDLRQLLLLYRVEDQNEVSELVELARLSRRKPWWTRYKDTVPGSYLSFVGLEDDCTSMQCFYPQGWPGLFQTEEFAHALVDASWTSELGPETHMWPLQQSLGETTRRVDLRMMRQQEVLNREHPPDIEAVLDEAVLRREIGGAELLRRQLHHLIELAGRPHITVRVLPFTAHMVNMLSPFVILQFPDATDTDVVYSESAFEQAVLDGATEVETYRQVYERVRDAALPTDRSIELIARIAGELG